MFNDYEIKYEIEKLKRWSYWLCIRVCKLEKLEGIGDNEDAKPPTEEEDKKEEEEDKSEPSIEEDEIHHIRDMVYGDKYVAVNTDGVYYSIDGEKWIHKELPNFEYNYDITISYGNNIYIISSDTDKIYYSYDGIDWNVKQITIPSMINQPAYAPQIHLIKFCGDKFIGLPREPSPLSIALPICSDDGLDWSECDFGSYEDYEQFEGMHGECCDIAYNGQMIVIIGGGGLGVVYTEDGQHWKVNNELDYPYGVGKITYGNNKFIASWGGSTGSTSGIWTCAHPSNWTKTVPISHIICQGFMNNRFVVWTTDDTLADYVFKSSTDGINWIEEEELTSDEVDVKFIKQASDFKFIVNDLAVGDEYVAKYTNNKWDVKNPDDVDFKIYNLKYINNKYYICTDYFLVSEDGDKWQKLYYIEP